MMTFELLGRRPSTLKASDLTKTSHALARALRMRKPHHASLQFASEKRMHRLNREWMGRNCSTDVLSFPSADVPVGKSEPVEMGDIVVCAPYAAREAKRRAIAPREELIRLIVHGTLHLAGYDHATAKDEERMFGLQEQIVEHVYE